MARIAEFEHLPRRYALRLHDPVDCGVRVLGPESDPVLQLETYGSASREFRGKVSQVIQIDEAAARRLLKILTSTFPRLRSRVHD